jgi:hypothetical protein
MWVEIKLFFFSDGCLLFLSLCSRGFQDLLNVRPSSLLMLCGCIFFLLCMRPDYPSDQISLLYNGHSKSFLEIKRPTLGVATHCHLAPRLKK